MFARSISILLVLWGLVVTLGPSVVAAEEPSSRPAIHGRDLAEALRRGGYVVYLRHAPTNPTQVDADRPDFTRCETQRNLSDEGRRMARDIGAAFKALGIRVGKVVSSPYCRTVDTAELAFGRHEVSPVMFFAMGVAKEERADQSVKLRQMLSAPPAPGTNNVFVGHNANIKEAAGIWPKREGDAHVFRPVPTGFNYVGEINAEDWGRWASDATAKR
jgi:phosphohistidine phosphatase SixA